VSDIGQPRRVLARSLDPLPEESLAGFLLRTSYRLERTPSRLALVSGLLNPQSRVSPQHLLKLSSPTLEEFSVAMRLTTNETTGMTLAGLQRRLPALADLWRVAPYGQGRTRASSWAMSYSSRYCPECLRGDGPPVQDAFGGAWKVRWYVPAVFACATHRRLLESFCPSCHRVLNGRAGAHGGLICKPGVMGLHPSQCRNPAPGEPTGSGFRPRPCGVRLDKAAAVGGVVLSPRDLDRLLALQERVDRGLAGSPSGAVDGEELEDSSLPDLVAAAQLILMSWPVGASLADSQTLADLIDVHARPLTQRRFPGMLARSAPIDAGQCGALLQAAESLLGDRDFASLHERVRPLSRETQRRAPGFVRSLAQSGHMSLTLTRATGHRLHGFQWDSRIRAQSRIHGYRLEEVPPYLPLSWFNSYFASLVDRLPHTDAKLLRHLRRAASLRLAELACGEPWPRCAVALGKPESSGVHTLNVLGRLLNNASLWPRFEKAVGHAANASRIASTSRTAGRRLRVGGSLRATATAEVALSAGWQYGVVAGWRRHVWTNVDALSAERRPLPDVL
jgi:hypothetical protein